ncbi:ribonucleoside-diphosphate reductase alpha chain [Streptomyces africanus]|uniref:Vitamin B12-dependent ribonucleotide reductase n=1 Tax=Streptomyces africanus TaxID=231024 RepID=A0ABU0QZB6_9ACTN|nr:ribonucleoside-diphosphate reductase alpha chain [Streptomyces africanus]
MTETASGPARSSRAKSTKASKGLRIERIHTTPGVHPYDEVAWERRDVVMTNWRDGSVNFEQRGVEFPDFWSVNAVNIVTSKYFRGAVGTPQRETSLKQLIDRIVKTYRKAGEDHKYFASPADAEIFEHELAYALLHQIFSFNSPVWFNVGTKQPQQVSACFILSVDDSMESILDWYKEEGMIFKGGSGAGLNLSRIRSSKELLSSGGNASGPVSFMRGADASAGTIKSGGATRRAAKMVVLDVDHPDIEDFIETKVKEEEKIRVLRDAGFDMDLGGDDIASVQYQNANNSVRVNDEFMTAVEQGGKFGLRGRMTGEVIEEVDAKQLFRKIAEAAWACADPGIQYDDTINNWHTCPESGRITASNPCSEYMHLDNTSCNLASLNLMKFLKDDGKGNQSFEAERFQKVVELVITAMDISICFADFPTQKIGENTRAFRQLGIGYANLGALLMATGHAYDSDGGRSLAGAITSLMTGTAYRRSAELAAVVGPYDGYARNADAHKRVMKQHSDANDKAVRMDDLDTPVWAAASESWQDVLRLGEKNGFRNSQASVLAPTGTIGLAMSCDTTGVEPDLALVKFKKLVGGGSMQIVNGTVPQALRRLGYLEEQIEAIVAHIAEHGNVIDAPGLKPEHYEVFDCAMGERAISPMGHVRMMAAIQPWISGAISKTVNMPETATVEEVEEIYFEAWKLGVKALAIYRDNCKVGQPLSTKKWEEKAEEPAAVEAKVEKVVEYRPVRKRLPKGRPRHHNVLHRRRRRGLHDRQLIPGRRSGRGLPEDVQAGLDPRGHDGRLLHRGLRRPPVRRPAGDVRLEVHEHALRAGRHDGRPGRADGAVDRRLHLPPPGAGLPAVRDALRARHPLRRGASASLGDRFVRAERGRGRRRGLGPVGAARPGAEGRLRAEERRGGQARPADGPHQCRTGGDATGHPGRRPAVLLLRYEDAACRFLLHLRGLRLDQRLQLTPGLSR